MRHAKESIGSMKRSSSTKVPKGISVAAKSPAQLRGRSGNKPISGHVTGARKSSVSRGVKK